MSDLIYLIYPERYLQNAMVIHDEWHMTAHIHPSTIHSLTIWDSGVNHMSDGEAIMGPTLGRTARFDRVGGGRQEKACRGEKHGSDQLQLSASKGAQVPVASWAAQQDAPASDKLQHAPGTPARTQSQHPISHPSMIRSPNQHQPSHCEPRQAVVTSSAVRGLRARLPTTCVLR